MYTEGTHKDVQQQLGGTQLPSSLVQAEAGLLGRISSRPQKISLRVWSSINNEYICCVARPMLVTEWPVVSRKSEREKR